jgi:hypothetical protein
MKKGWWAKHFSTVLLIFVAFASVSVWGQWITQQVPLQPGWNAICLEVQPADNRCEAIFNGVAVESVWRWNKRFSSVEFSVDPNTLVPEDPHWLVWFPPDHPTAFLTRLYGMSAGGTYLVKLPANASPIILTIKGKVTVHRSEWSAHALGLIGFPVDPANAPSVVDYFHYTPEVDTSKGFENELYSLRSDGTQKGSVP